MLNVSGLMTLQNVVSEYLPTKDGRKFHKVELQGYVETGWSGQHMPTSFAVCVEPSKKAMETLGEVSMLAPGSKIKIEGYVKGSPYKGRIFTKIVATSCQVSNMGMHYAPPQQQQAPQQYAPQNYSNQKSYNQQSSNQQSSAQQYDPPLQQPIQSEQDIPDQDTNLGLDEIPF